MRAAAAIGCWLLLCLETVQASFEDKIGQKALYNVCLKQQSIGQEAMVMHKNCIDQHQQSQETDPCNEEDIELLCAKKFLDYPGLRQCIGSENTLTIEASIRQWKVFRNLSCTEEAKSLHEYSSRNESFCYDNPDNDTLMYCNEKAVIPTPDPEYPFTFAGFSYNQEYCRSWHQLIECEVEILSFCYNETAGDIIRRLYNGQWEVTPCANSANYLRKALLFNLFLLALSRKILTFS